MAGNIEVWPDGSQHVWDGPTQTYRETSPDGTTIVSRPFTPNEAAAYPATDPPTGIDPVAALQAQIDALTDMILGGGL